MERSLRSLHTLVRRRLLVGLGQRQPPRPFPIVIQPTEAPQQEIHQTRTPKGIIPRVVFPGAGIFFYWQAGAVTYLRDAGYDLDQTIVSGASAGAITATLCATHVDYYHATDVALRLGREAGVWDRPMGLMGVWGSLIEEWLDTILPAEAAEMANDRLSILLTQFPSILEKQRVNHFVDRDDLIRCNIASVHLPLFLDGSVASSYRDSLHIDGSFLSSPMDHFPDGTESILTFDFQHDPELKGKKKEFVKLASEDGVLSLLDRGAEFAEELDREGYFEYLPR